MTLSWADALNPPKAEATPVALGPITPVDGQTRYAATALAREVEAVAGAAEGTRNHTLNAAAFSLATLVASGALDYATVRDTLLQAAQAAGLPRVEAMRTIASGFRGGQHKPRDMAGVRELAAPDVVEVAVADLVTVGEHVDDAGQVWETFTGSTEPEAEAPRHTSWWAEPIEDIAAGQEATPPPDVLVRNDGHGLFYRGKVNGLIGESESGKTWVALHAAHQEAAAGGRVLVLDFEDTARTVRERLALLGCTSEAMARVWYANPDQSLDVVATGDLAATLATIGPTLIVLDGYNAAMTLLGLDLNSNTDATEFVQKLLRPLANTDAAVVTVDHVPKNAEARGKGGIGAQAKRAMTSGCTLRVEVAEPFGRGQDGRLKLYVDKDRPGLVRGNSGGAKYAGTFTIETQHNGSITAEVKAPDAPGEWRPTRLMAAISDLLETSGPLSKNKVEQLVKGDAVRIREALQHLINDGHVAISDGPRRSILCTLARPFGASVEEVPAHA